MFKLEHIDHVALTVRDVEASVRWYRDVLGLERMHQEAWGSRPAVMAAGGTGLALFQDTGIEYEGEQRMRHVAFSVDRVNFERAQQELAAKGIETSFSDHGIAHSIYLSDPDEYLIEITTYGL